MNESLFKIIAELYRLYEPLLKKGNHTFNIEFCKDKVRFSFSHFDMIVQIYASLSTLPFNMDDEQCKAFAREVIRVAYKDHPNKIPIEL